MRGWELHTKPYKHFEHSWVTVTIVPFFFMETTGFSSLQLKQKWENRLRSML
jgi:hypothetical protein